MANFTVLNNSTLKQPNRNIMQTRKEFIRNTGLLSVGSVLLPGQLFANSEPQTTHANLTSWPDDTRLVISVSMQFEAGGEPETGFDSPFPPISQKALQICLQKRGFSMATKRVFPGC